MEKRKKYVCGHFGRSLNSTVIEPKLIHRHRGLPVEGASINDICKFVRFFDPLPPYPHLELICSIKFMQPPLLHLLINKPPLRCGHHIWMLPKYKEWNDCEKKRISDALS